MGKFHLEFGSTEELAECIGLILESPDHAVAAVGIINRFAVPHPLDVHVPDEPAEPEPVPERRCQCGTFVFPEETDIVVDRNEGRNRYHYLDRKCKL